MRKFFVFVMLAAMAATMNSCLKGDEFDNGGIDPMSNGLAMFLQVNNQRMVAMDPFNVAVRFNTYLAEGKSIAVKDELFGKGVKITELADGEFSIEYESTNISVPKDLLRNGVLNIKTYGKMLTDEGAAWVVYTPSTDMEHFRVSINTGVWTGVIIAENDYVITNNNPAGGTEWNLMVNKFVSAPLPMQKPMISSWNINADMTKDTPGSDLASYKNSLFTMKFVGTGDQNGGITFYNTKYSTDQLASFVYKPSCANPRRAIVGAEKLTLTYGIGTNLQTDEVDILYGEVPSCDNKTKVTYKGNTREVTY